MHKLHFDTALLADGWRNDVTISVALDGSIAEIELNSSGQAERSIALPGLPNLHSHAFQRGMAGLTEHAGATPDSFWTWRELMYRFLAKLDPDDVEAIAALAYCDMLEGGFTTVGEFHYLHHAPDGRPYDNVAEMALRHASAAVETGIGLALLPVFYAHGNFGGTEPAQGQRRFLNDLDSFARLVEASRSAIRPLPWARLGIAPHSLRAVTTAELAELVSTHPAAPIHMHISEQVKEVDDCLAAHGVRPVDFLFDNVAVNAHWCLIHATHADMTERAKLARSGAVVGLCPITESNLGDGIFGAVNYLAAQGRFGVGTDSNVLLSAATELRTLEYSQRLVERRRNALAPRNTSTGRLVYEGAVRGGAQALDLGAPGLQVGARADIVVLDGNAIDLFAQKEDGLLDAYLFAGARQAIREVYTLGQRVVVDGRHVRRDAIERRYKKVLKQLLV